MDEQNSGVVEEGLVSASTEPTEAAGTPDPQISQEATGEAPAPGQENKELEGIKQDLISKRRENAEYKRTLAQVQAELAELKGYLKPPDEPTFRDDDVITFGDYKRYEEAKQAEAQKKSFQQQYSESYQRALKRNDFEERVSLLEEAIASDPRYRGLDRVFMEIPNGPEIAYEFAEHLLSKKKSAQADQVSKKLDTNMSKPPNLTGGTASPILDETQRIARMDPMGSEFQEMVRKVEGVGY